MSINFVIDIVVALLFAGFIYWALMKFIVLIPGPPIVRQAIEAILIVVVVAIVLFYVIVPILHLIGAAVPSIRMPTPGR